MCTNCVKYFPTLLRIIEIFGYMVYSAAMIVSAVICMQNNKIIIWSECNAHTNADGNHLVDAWYFVSWQTVVVDCPRRLWINFFLLSEFCVGLFVYPFSSVDWWKLVLTLFNLSETVYRHGQTTECVVCELKGGRPNFKQTENLSP